jgi:hypothetical protein
MEGDTHFCTVFGILEENRKACSPEGNFRPGAGKSSEGEYEETSGQRSVFGRPPSGIGKLNQCNHPWCPRVWAAMRIDANLAEWLLAWSYWITVARTGEPA